MTPLRPPPGSHLRHAGCGCAAGGGLSRRRLLLGGAAAGATLALAGCAQNPATGRSSFTGFSDIGDDVRLGAQEYPKLLEEFGGPYQDSRLQGYADAILRKLVPFTEYPDLPWQVTVANTPIVNAFALPGGKITITRGLLAMASSEAELAGVVAHEVGHVTARHSAERQGAGLLASLGVLVLGAATGSSELANLAGYGAQAYIQGYSRDQEMEADLLGVRYMTAAGYDPEAMASFLQTLGDQARLEARMAGRDPGDVDAYNIMATHPRSVDRVRQAMQLAETVRLPDPVVGREPYLNEISGMLFGDDPEQGLILDRGRRFVHPQLRIAFDAPDGFRLVNGKSRVTAQHPAGAAAVVDLARGRTPEEALARWAGRAAAGRAEALSLNGLPAATVPVRLDSRSGPVRGQAVVAAAPAAGTVVRFLFIAPPGQFGRFDEAFRRMTYSFRHLSPAEASAVQPLRLIVTRVEAADTIRDLSARMPYGAFNDDWFRLLNDLAVTDGLQAGELVKIVTQ